VKTCDASKDKLLSGWWKIANQDLWSQK
jgi:hypothetical protein